jgi:hypothetical protein
LQSGNATKLQLEEISQYGEGLIGILIPDKKSAIAMLISRELGCKSSSFLKGLSVVFGLYGFKLKEEDYDSLKDWKTFAEFFIIKKGDFSVLCPSNLRFAQANVSASTLFFNSVPTYLEMRVAGTSSVIKAYSANLTSFNQKMLTVFASGFVNPTANQNGKNFGVFAVDTNGNVLELQESTRIQFIHNAADVALQSVDIFLNNNKVAAALNFRNATPFLTVNTGNTQVRISTANQTDTLFFIPSINLVSGKSYLAMAMGLKDTNGFTINPDGVNRILNVTGFDSMPESSLLAGSFQYLVANVNTDAPQLSFNIVPSKRQIVGYR